MIRVLIVSLTLAAASLRCRYHERTCSRRGHQGRCYADRHIAYGGRPEADHSHSCRDHLPQVKAGFSIARQEVAKRRMGLARLLRLLGNSDVRL